MLIFYIILFIIFTLSDFYINSIFCILLNNYNQIDGPRTGSETGLKGLAEDLLIYVVTKCIFFSKSTNNKFEYQNYHRYVINVFKK